MPRPRPAASGLPQSDFSATRFSTPSSRSTFTGVSPSLSPPPAGFSLVDQLPSQCERILARGCGNFVNEALHCEMIPIRIHGAPVAARNGGVQKTLLQQIVRDCAAGKPGAGNFCAAGIGNFAAEEGAVRRGSGDVVQPAGDLTLRVQAGAQAMVRDRAIVIVTNVIIASPDHFHGSGCRARDQGCFDSVINAEATAKSAAD